MKMKDKGLKKKLIWKGTVAEAEKHPLYQRGKEDVLEVLRKYPISANFDDAMDILKFKEKVKTETLTEVGKVINELPARVLNDFRKKELKQKLGIGVLK